MPMLGYHIRGLSKVQNDLFFTYSNEGGKDTLLTSATRIWGIFSGTVDQENTLSMNRLPRHNATESKDIIGCVNATRQF